MLVENRLNSRVPTPLTLPLARCHEIAQFGSSDKSVFGVVEG
jgi:hypothetical protein